MAYDLDDEPLLIDARAAGRLLGVPHTWLLREARAGRIPHIRLGRYVRYQPDELVAWALERARGPRPRSTTPGAAERLRRLRYVSDPERAAREWAAQAAKERIT